MSELSAFDTRLAGLIAALSPQSRKAMASTIAKRLRKHQQQRIKRQVTPEGQPFAPRRAQPLRAKKGRIRREMFAKLRTAKYMKAKGTDKDAVVEFTGQVQRIVKVHQYGLRDRPSVRAKEVQYQARPLLGLDAEDMKILEEEFFSYLQTG
ncbi:phage virion morphogenesis protein [Rahnella victoriana]|uniref:phage virion morphogenesis protein n=1 Tax=Rahnella victoriana TaxID=1510570 RepID=UPI001E575684|nr:phage virion morphogenesis protein [Rahnella victoriana]UHM90784.1 phage virion morphogenesis protein [Rahnella victoriana]UHM90822.1 phage virion morphogenesis protein [Rahnella victoriana]